MPLPTANELTGLFYEMINFARKADEMRQMVSLSSGEVAIAYQTLLNDYEFKLRNKINKMWLYTCDSTTEL